MATRFADEAFQIAGQPAYDYIMKHPEYRREKMYNKLKKYGSLNFFLTPTFFADEAFQIVGQPGYDYIMKMPEDKREHAYKKLKKYGSLNFFLTPTFFADEAFQIVGQPGYDYIMSKPEDKRERAFKKLKVRPRAAVPVLCSSACSVPMCAEARHGSLPRQGAQAQERNQGRRRTDLWQS